MRSKKYKNKLDKSCFQHMVYQNFKTLPRRTAADNVLREEAFNITRNPSCNRYQCVALVVYNFVIKNLQIVVLKVKLYRTNN